MKLDKKVEQGVDTIEMFVYFFLLHSGCVTIHVGILFSLLGIARHRCNHPLCQGG